MMIEKINALVAEELEAANGKFPLFHSDHEAYAVLLEEFDEANEEIGRLKNAVDWLWSDTKDKHKAARPAAYRRQDLAHARKFAIRGAMELIQVAAMCDKWGMLLTHGGGGRQ